jgi:hypothetical protein
VSAGSSLIQPEPQPARRQQGTLGAAHADAIAHEAGQLGAVSAKAVLVAQRAVMIPAMVGGMPWRDDRYSH